jgi:hypothetical protein
LKLWDKHVADIVRAFGGNLADETPASALPHQGNACLHCLADEEVIETA